jgi:hypothetical protein
VVSLLTGGDLDWEILDSSCEKEIALPRRSLRQGKRTRGGVIEREPSLALDMTRIWASHGGLALELYSGIG